jgi:hypothetical protein
MQFWIWTFIVHYHTKGRDAEVGEESLEDRK